MTPAFPAPCGGLSWNSTTRSVSAMAPADHATTGVPVDHVLDAEEPKPIQEHRHMPAGDDQRGRVPQRSGDGLPLPRH